MARGTESWPERRNRVMTRRSKIYFSLLIILESFGLLLLLGLLAVKSLPASDILRGQDLFPPDLAAEGDLKAT